MSAHQSHTWRCPARGLTGGVTRPVQHRQLVSPRGKRARKLFWRRFRNAQANGLPTAMIPGWACRLPPGMTKKPVWACGPKPRPPGPSGSVAIPNPKPDQPTNHGGTVRR